MGFAEYSNYDGLGLAELVKKKKVKPAELVAWTNLLTQESRIDSRLLFAEGSLDSRTDDRR